MAVRSFRLISLGITLLSIESYYSCFNAFAGITEVEKAYTAALRQIRNRERASTDEPVSLNATLQGEARAAREAVKQRKPSSSRLPRKGAVVESFHSADSDLSDITGPTPASVSSSPILDESSIPREIQFSGHALSDADSPHTHTDPNQKLEELNFTQ